MTGFRPGLALTCQVGVALVTVLVLSVWQFQRGIEKTELAADRDSRLAATPLTAADYTPATPDFTRMSLAGRYVPERSFFVVDRSQAWRYLVVTPMRTDHGTFLLTRGRVDRRQLDDRSLPPVDTPAEITPVTAVFWPSEGAARTDTWPEGWPKAIGGMNIGAMAELTRAQPRELRLETPSPGLDPAPLIHEYAPGTHFSYSVQWLLIGAVIAVGYVVVGRRRAAREAPC